MKIFICTVIAMCLGIFQSAIPLGLGNIKFSIDFVLVFMAISAWHYGTLTGIVIGFFAGLILDILGLAPMGFHAFIYIIMGYLCGLLRNNVSPKKFFMPLLAVFTFGIIKYILAYLVALVFDIQTVFIQNFNIKPFLTGTIANLLVTHITFWVFLLSVTRIEGKRGGFHGGG